MDFFHRDTKKQSELNLLKIYYEKDRLGKDEESFINLFTKFPYRNIFVIAPCGAGKSCFLHWCMKIKFSKNEDIKWGIINLIRTGMIKADIAEAVHRQLDEILNHYYSDLTVWQVLRKEITALKKAFKNKSNEDPTDSEIKERIKKMCDSVFDKKEMWNLKRIKYLSEEVLKSPNDNFNLIIDNIDNYEIADQLKACSLLLTIFADKKFRLILPIRPYNSFHVRNQIAINIVDPKYETIS
ncbi:hypothetical protein [Candidatus Magnetomonas plexicatena]|uniref:hypothetical protein n=1 Tax=Candidatus Magnetomonas plexicatena TaxID=2552947 RepID=UPI001102EBEE|nr:hypothetical protein E2O03_005480 [Nitrospirales bacterium LBB_01]